MAPRLPLVIALVLLVMSAPALAQVTEPFDHIHLAVSDVARAHDWYVQYMGGNDGETPESVAWGKWPGDHPLPIQLLFFAAGDTLPSEGTLIDHIGFSFSNLEAKVEELRTRGVTIVSPVTTAPGLGKHAVVKDPWGTKLVLLDDPDAPGIHHIELRVPDPEGALSWYIHAFGGDRVRYKGAIDAIRYRDLGVFYLFVTKDDKAMPTQGHAIDHVAFGPIDLDKVVAVLNAGDTTFTSNPNPRINPGCRFVPAAPQRAASDIRRLSCAQPESLAHRVVFVLGPGGVRIELLQHLEAGGH